MTGRDTLGPADVTDDQLARMVADLLGTDPVETSLVGATAEEVDYDIPAITTAGRYWVRGSVEVSGEELPFELFVKHVQSWARSPFFEMVPPELREMAEASVPWRTEPLAYRSDLGDRLPEGLTMPRAVGVFDLDERSSAVWLEVAETDDVVWNHARFARAAHLLGRLAGSAAVRELATVGQFDWTIRNYVTGRLNVQVLPLLRDPAIWKHPLVAAAFDDDLRARLQVASDRVPMLVEELAAMPEATMHGDACPNNLLCAAGSDDFVLIDYGFWNLGPIGFDLSQLLVGDVQVGRQPASELPAIEAAIVPAYVQGLEAEGCDVPESVVRRAHALQLMIFTGLSTLPFELLDSPPTPALHEDAAGRAAIARLSLDLLAATD
ncbi:MAG: phosphotransferase [Marmoricola sp.]